MTRFTLDDPMYSAPEDPSLYDPCNGKVLIVPGQYGIRHILQCQECGLEVPIPNGISFHVPQFIQEMENHTINTVMQDLGPRGWHVVTPRTPSFPVQKESDQEPF